MVRVLGSGGHSVVLSYDERLADISTAIDSVPLGKTETEEAAPYFAPSSSQPLAVKLGFSHSHSAVSSDWCIFNECPCLDATAQLREAQILARLKLVQHPHIIPLLGLVEVSEEIDTGYYDQDPVTGLGLVVPRGWATAANVIGTTECKLRHLTRAFLALEYLHSQGYYHIDFKAENIVINGDKTWLIDFGSAVHLAEKGLYFSGGTPGYSAPELSRNGPLSAAADVWSAGIAIIRVIAGWRDRNQNAWTKQLPVMTEKLGPAVAELLNGMLALDRTKRWTMTQVLDHAVFEPVRSVITETRALAIPPMEPPLVVEDIPNLVAHPEWDALRTKIKATYVPANSEVIGQALVLMDRYLPQYNTYDKPLLQLYYVARIIMYSHCGRRVRLGGAINQPLSRAISYDIIEHLPLHQLTVAPIPEARVREWLGLLEAESP